jgi:hypothetical protein
VHQNEWLFILTLSALACHGRRPEIKKFPALAIGPEILSALSKNVPIAEHFWGGNAHTAIRSENYDVRR